MDRFPLPSIENVRDQIHFNTETPNAADKLYIFGRNPEFSLGELVALYNSGQKKVNFKDLTSNGAIIHGEKTDSDPKGNNSHISINECGSLLKRCKILGCFKTPLDPNQLASLFTGLFQNIYLDEKPNWSISAYNSKPEDVEADTADYNMCQELIKDALKENGIKKAYFVPPVEDQSLQPQRLYHKNIIQAGFEIVIWFRNKDIVLGQTEQVIDIDGFTDRDKERPFTRPLLLLGLAVARTMINLLNIEIPKPNLIVYDPFCGMGSVVQEALLLGYTAWGSDIEGECVVQSQQNLEWVAQKMRMKKINPDIIFRMDIKSPEGSKFKDHPMGIVTEPDLLSPLKDYPHMLYAKKLITAYEQNYSAYLGAFAQIMDPDSICVLIFPRLHIRDHSRLSLNILNLLEKYQFQVCQFGINNIKMDAHFLHAWKEQIIEREIVVFRKKAH